tara:strand:- start:193 stop:480 length:288 start_codon:yes stop_codon:yes gene_type:complete
MLQFTDKRVLEMKGITKITPEEKGYLGLQLNTVPSILFNNQVGINNREATQQLLDYRRATEFSIDFNKQNPLSKQEKRVEQALNVKTNTENIKYS